MDVNMNSGDIKWFINGVLNVTVNCLDRHARDNPDRVAVLWEKDEPKQHEPVTYKQLLDMTCQVANVLKSQGIRKGDRVVLYLPMIPLAVAIILACARIGAIHSIVFAGFSAEALSSRINDATAETVITADEGVRGGKTIPLKETVDTALKESPCVKRVLVATRTGAAVPMAA
ncbi:PREDICTED: acetyl-coenzyme A synthetase 2-like, mitochondrial, partial [Amphimedon queenslandica]|uniref:acetate--CoA ligase n=2 Tax=Amphimedon queenslandica TaxID=400682 RepID=A0AAN0IJD3_AMPQE